MSFDLLWISITFYYSFTDNSYLKVLRTSIELNKNNALVYYVLISYVNLKDTYDITVLPNPQNRLTHNYLLIINYYKDSI